MPFTPFKTTAMRAGLCAALLVVATGAPAQVNQAAQAAGNETTQGTDQTALRLTQALGTCFTEPDGIDEMTAVTLRFRLLGTGKLEGVPRRVGNVNKTGDEQKLYFHSLQTLYDCAPFPINDEGGEFDAVMSATGVDQVYLSQNAPTPEAEPATTAAASGAIGEALATEDTEAELGLDRTARRELQLRLRLIGFDPQGVDGVFGPNTRSAISDWQASAGVPETGYLNATQLEELRVESQAEFAAYEPPRASPPATQTRQRVRVCRRTGILGIKFCRYEYR